MDAALLIAPMAGSFVINPIPVTVAKAVLSLVETERRIKLLHDGLLHIVEVLHELV
jgi:hypothetical protein